MCVTLALHTHSEHALEEIGIFYTEIIYGTFSGVKVRSGCLDGEFYLSIIQVLHTVLTSSVITTGPTHFLI